MSGLFGGTSAPPIAAPDPAPAPPSIDQAAKDRENEDAARRRRGRATTILTGALGAGSPQTAAKTLLGG